MGLRYDRTHEPHEEPLSAVQRLRGLKGDPNYLANALWVYEHREALADLIEAARGVVRWVEADAEAMIADGHEAPYYPWEEELIGHLSRLT